MLQILLPAYRDVTVRVAFGSPLRAEDLLAVSTDIGTLTDLVIARARELIPTIPGDRIALSLRATGTP
jgi:hypothetical protein